MLRRRIPLMLIVAALAALTVAAPSSARNASGSTLPATLEASSPVRAWSQYSVKGCGFVTGAQVNMVINGGLFFATAVDAGGCTSFTWWADAAGTVYDVKAYQQLKGRRQTLMAQTTLTVE